MMTGFLAVQGIEVHAETQQTTGEAASAVESVELEAEIIENSDVTDADGKAGPEELLPDEKSEEEPPIEEKPEQEPEPPEEKTDPAETGKKEKDLSGPVGIVDAIGTTYEESKSEGTMILWMNMLNLAVLLSANLGVMNLLPFPALDGGRLVFLVIEAIRRKPINRQVEGGIHFAGLMLLMALMVFVMYNDIVKLI